MRPMVVGDRLWVFSQTPGAPPTPLQSVMLSNPPLAPPAVGHLRPSPDLMMARSALMARGQLMSGYPPPSKSLPPSPYMNRMQPIGPYKSFGPILTQRIKPDIYDFHSFKYLAHEPPSVITRDSGIKELEKAFGNPATVLYGNDTGDEKSGGRCKDGMHCEDIEVNDDCSLEGVTNEQKLISSNESEV